MSSAIAVQAMTLNEIMFDPDVSDATNEFIELYNESIFAIGLSGWHIAVGLDTNAIIALNQGLIAAPHQYVLVMDPDYFEENSHTYDGLVPDTALVVTIDNSAFGSRGLSNSRSDTIALIDPQGIVRSRFAYHLGNAEGYSDEKISVQNGDSTSNWVNSLVHNGTPGARNSVTPADRDLAITAFYAIPPVPHPGDSYVAHIDVKNTGRITLSDSVYLCDVNERDSLDELNGWFTGSLAPGDSIELTHTLQLLSTTPLALIARLSGSDENPSNDRRSLIVSAAGSTHALVINEIMFNPEAQRSEWVELANPGSVPWNIAGWKFADGTGIADTLRCVTLADITIPAQGYAILAADSAIFFENIPSAVPIAVWNTSHISLNNTGDSLCLFSSDGQVVDRVDYRPSWNSAGAGTSLERVSMQAVSNDPLNWASSLDSTGGTPGRVNSRALPTGSKGVELLTLQPNPFSPDGDGHDDMLSIQYRLDNADSRLDLKIYDVRGRLIRRLANNEAAGFSGEKLWDGKDDHGRMMPTGLYIIYLEALGKGGTRIQTTRRPIALARRS